MVNVERGDFVAYAHYQCSAHVIWKMGRGSVGMHASYLVLSVLKGGQLACTLQTRVVRL